jgi:hypothetical protein
VGEPVTAASVPGGDYAPIVAETAAAAGYTILFTSEPTSRSLPVSGLTLCGRFTIQRWTTPGVAAALSRGAWTACARQHALWSVKKLGKRIGGPMYLQVRKAIIGHGSDVSWGDQT